jgi:hypothetical protein
MAERASTPLSICLSDPQEGAQNSVKKESILGPIVAGESHEALTLHSLVADRRSPWLTQFARCEYLKRHDVSEREGELGANVSAVVMPRSARGVLLAGELDWNFLWGGASLYVFPQGLALPRPIATLFEIRGHVTVISLCTPGRT